MKDIGVALLSALGGYLGGIPLGIFAVEFLSDNTHDKQTEAAMTSAFVIAPILALFAAIGGVALYHHLRQA
jgi:hypothetical protein